MDLSVCFIATEIFSWGRYGGIGSCTRIIGTHLAERGVRVSVVVPKGVGQKPVEMLDGMIIYSFPMSRYLFTDRLYRSCDADIYHSEEPSLGTRIAMNSNPERRHIATFQNPRTKAEWSIVYPFYPLRRRIFNTLYDSKMRETVKKLDKVYCQARYIISKVRDIYGLDRNPGFLPNPVKIPKHKPKKASEPTVCFLGRLDGEKRPEIFFELAKRFSKIKFIALGAAHDAKRDAYLRKTYGKIPNLELAGLKIGKEKDQVLDKSWILVNTSVSECLPVSFLEAAAHRCAILSFHDPDGFSSNFGYHAKERDLDKGLLHLLEGDNWREKGEKGYGYVSKIHEVGKVIDDHVNVYKETLESD